MEKCHLCLCVLLSIAGGALAFRMTAEQCGSAPRVIGEFYENPCRYTGGRETVQKLRSQLYRGQLTVRRLQAFVSKVCSEVMPEIRQCFAESVSVCEESRQQYLNQIATNTSVLCRANSTKPSRWMSLVLSKLLDEQVTYNRACARRGSRRHERDCRVKAGGSSGLTNLDPSVYRTSNVENMLPVLHSYYTTYFTCRVQRLRDDQNRCPSWRLYGLLVLFHDMIPPPLGVQLEFTPTQIEDMFEL